MTSVRPHSPAACPPLYCLDKGQGADAIILLPGLHADHRVWQLVQRHLARKHRTIAVDNRGFGRSFFDGQSLTVSGMVQDTIALMDSLDLSRCFIVGHSMGGAIAQTMAQQFPQRVNGLVLCNAFRYGAGARLQRLAEMLEKNPREVCEAQWREVGKSMLERLFADADLASLVEQIAWPGIHPEHRAGLMRQIEALRGFDSRPWFHTIRAPVLIAHAIGDEPHFGAEALAMADSLAGAQHLLLRGGHASPLEAWRDLSIAIGAFVDAHGCRSDTAFEMSSSG